MKILGIDPGPQDSAGAVWDTEKQSVINTWHSLNLDLLPGFQQFKFTESDIGLIVIEDPQAMRRPASDDFINTVKWSARFYQAILNHCELGEFDKIKLIPYRDVSTHFCTIVNAKEKFVKDKIIQQYGPEGTKKNPGPLYGVKGHSWSALAVALVGCGTVTK